MKNIYRNFTSLCILVIAGVILSGCYTQLALDTSRPTYRNKQYREEPPQKQKQEDLVYEEQKNDEEEFDDYDTQEGEYSNTPVVNNYYLNENDWYPRFRAGYSYYWPSTSFWVSYNNPWANDWYYPNQWYSNYSYYDYYNGWCYSPFVSYYYPWNYPTYGYWHYHSYYYGYGYGASYTPNPSVRTVRDFGRNRDGDEDLDRGSRGGSDIRSINTQETSGGMISTGRNGTIDKSGKKTGIRDGNQTRVRNSSGRYGERGSRSRQPERTRDYRVNVPPLDKADVDRTTPSQNTSPKTVRENTPRQEVKPTNVPRQQQAPPQQQRGTSRPDDKKRGDERQ